jgi:hypothetical protein
MSSLYSITRVLASKLSAILLGWIRAADLTADAPPAENQNVSVCSTALKNMPVMPGASPFSPPPSFESPSIFFGRGCSLLFIF